MLQKPLFSHTFYKIHVWLLLQKNEGNSDNKNHGGVLILYLLIIQIIFIAI